MTIARQDAQTVTGHIYLAKEPELFSYDADGNLTNDGRWAYTWDAENRLVGMTTNTASGPGYQLTFAYDYQGRRTQKIVATNGLAYATNNFLYDGWNLIAEVAAPSGSLVRNYVWGNDLSGSVQGAGGVGGLLAVAYHGNLTTNCYLAFDGNGNVMALINAADGTLAAEYDYGPFAEPIRTTGVLGRNNPLRFSMEYQDDESDMLYYGYRYYSAALGRWLNRDPLAEGGGLNSYDFLAGNPLNDIDSLGLCGGGEGGGQNCRCGPDVTSLVWQTMADIRKDFTGIKSSRKKFRACMKILASPASSSNWDVNWMIGMSNESVPRCTYCGDTLTYDGKCYQRYALWYFLYGEAANDCNRSFPLNFGHSPPAAIDPLQTLLAGLIARAPFSHDSMTQIYHKVAVASYFSARTSNLPNQEPQCPAANGITPKNPINWTDWHWDGIPGHYVGQ